MTDALPPPPANPPSRKSEKPRPETTRAFLISAGLRKPTATSHHYLETRLVTLPGPGGGSAWAFIFQCFRTGAERIWGVEPLEDDLGEGAN